MSWREEDEDYKVGGAKTGLRSKPRFSFNEVKVLLEAVMRNRYIILRKFNQGVSAETKKQTWAEITNQVNDLGENHREVRQIMKKWADLKCDGKRRVVAFRSSNMRKKILGPVEKMVHKILMMSPQGDGDSDPDYDPGDDEDFHPKLFNKGPTPSPAPYSYLSLTDSSHSLPGGASLDMSPLSSPEKEHGSDPLHSSSDFDQADDADRAMDFEENDDSTFSSYSSTIPPALPSSAPQDPLPAGAPLRLKPVHTYSRTTNNNNNGQNHTPSFSRPPPGPSTSSAFPPDSDAPPSSSSSAAPPAPQSPTRSSSSSTIVLPPPPPAAANDSEPPPPASSAPTSSSSSSSTSVLLSVNPSPLDPSDPLPTGASSRDIVAQMAAQGLEQQRASRMLLTSVSQSLEALAQSVQLLVESQHEFVQESLMLQRETVDILRDFSNTTLTMLRDKSSSGHLATQQQHPSSHF